MRQRTSAHRPHTATVRRRVQQGTNDLGEPIYSGAVVAASVPCLFEGDQTELTREDGGERVATPATVTLNHQADITEGDTLEISGPGTPDEPLEVRGITEEVNPRTGQVLKIVSEVEQA